jgi:hypothetical protein
MGAGWGIAVLVSAGCGLVTGVGNLEVVPCVADCGVDGASRDAMSFDGSSRDSGVVDAEVDTAFIQPDTSAFDQESSAPCAAASTCVAPFPPGWTLAAFDPTARSACPTGYGGTEDLVVDPNLGPSACACACSLGNHPSCTDGTLAHTFGGSNNCGSTGPVFKADGCIQDSENYTSAFHGAGPLAASGGSCTAVESLTPPAAGTQGIACTLTGSLGSACAGGGACAPSVLTQLCIVHAGSESCPEGYATPHTVGTSVTPGGCAPCACPTPTATCANPLLTFYSDANCAVESTSLNADGDCDPTTIGAFLSYEYSVDVTMIACPAPAPPMPSGNATLAGEQTICCP